MDHSEHEKQVAQMLATKYGKRVELLPRIVIPEKTPVADYLIDGVKYDLKSIRGSGKDAIRDAIKRKEKQAHNFVLHVGRTELKSSEIEAQVQNVYRAKNTRFVRNLVVIDDNKVLRVYERV